MTGGVGEAALAAPIADILGIGAGDALGTILGTGAATGAAVPTIMTPLMGAGMPIVGAGMGALSPTMAGLNTGIGGIDIAKIIQGMNQAGQGMNMMNPQPPPQQSGTMGGGGQGGPPPNFAKAGQVQPSGYMQYLLQRAAARSPYLPGR